jgi:hypothetical protein
MEPTIVQKEGIIIMGIATRTLNAHEADPATARIPGMWQRFFTEHVEEQFSQRINPAVHYAVYTDYESDYTGAYTYILGSAVSSKVEIPEGMVKFEPMRRIPEGKALFRVTYFQIAIHLSLPIPHIQLSQMVMRNHFDGSLTTYDLCRSSGSRSRAGVDGGEIDITHCLAQPGRLTHTQLRQRRIVMPLHSSYRIPFSLTMPRDIKRCLPHA